MDGIIGTKAIGRPGPFIILRQEVELKAIDPVIAALVAKVIAIFLVLVKIYGLLVGENPGNAGTAEDLLTEGGHRIIVGGDIIPVLAHQFACLGIQQSGAESLSQLTAQTGPEKQRSPQTNSPGKEHLGTPEAKITEQIAVLQEKLPFFRKEQFKTGDVGLLLVHLHGGKVRIDRQIEVHGSGERDFPVKSRFPVKFNLVVHTHVLVGRT